MEPKTIEQRVMAAIRPTLEKADVLIDSYMPDKYRVIGKHHPEYGTLGGQLHYLRRKADQMQDEVLKNIYHSTWEAMVVNYGHLPMDSIEPPPYAGKKSAT